MNQTRTIIIVETWSNHVKHSPPCRENPPNVSCPRSRGRILFWHIENILPMCVALIETLLLLIKLTINEGEC